MCLFKLRVFSGYTPRSGIARKYDVYFSLFNEPPLFSMVAAPIYIPTNSGRGFPFSTSSPAFIAYIFYDGHSDQCEVIIHSGFDLHFSISKGFPGDSVGEKKSTSNAGDPGSVPWRRKWQPTPVFLPGEFHGQRSLVGYRGCRVRCD